MSMTDPIADMLTRIRNALQSRAATVDLPASKTKLAIVKILEAEGYVRGHEVIEEGPQGVIRVTLGYTVGGQQVITGLERVSRPGRRVYRGKNEIPDVLGGLGVSILSTPKGIQTGRACRQMGIGGEVLCKVW